MKAILSKSLLSAFFLVIGFSSVGQVTVAPSALLNLVDNVLRGPGIQISNVTGQGNIGQQFGEFTDAQSTTGFGSGVIMSTGNIQSFVGPNSSDSITLSGLAGLSNTVDPDVILLSGGQSNIDQAILEFDVVPDGDAINLELLFASDEYPERVCSNMADIMGVIITGPGITGPYLNNGELISLTGNGLPIGLNAINNGVAGVLGNGSCTTGSFGNTGSYIANTGNILEMDGYTTPLLVSKTVQCGQSYHIKIVLADVGGFNSESCLLLNAGGLYSSGVHADINSLYNDSSIVEGCKPFILYFNRPVTGGTEVIDVNVAGSAVLGTDYTMSNVPVTFGPSDSIIQVTIEATDDGIAEGPENIILSFFLISECGDTIWNQYEFWLFDRTPFDVIYTPEHTLCDGDQVLLNAIVTGGVGSNFLTWDGLNANNFTITPTEDTIITLYIIDDAGCEFYGLVDINHVPIPNVNAGPDIEICKNESVEILASTDADPGASIVWFPTIFLSDENTITPIITNPTLGGSYTVTVTTPEGCTNSDVMNYTALVIPFADANGGGSIVYEQETIVLLGNVTGSPVWVPGEFVDCPTCNNVVASPTDDTWFYLFAFGANGCRVKDSVFVEVTVPKDVFVPTAFSPNGDGFNDVFYVRGYTIERMAFKVYDKWGSEIFFSDDVNIGWDGTINGMEAQAGLYTYVLQVDFVNNKGSETFSGETTLIR